MVKKALAVFVTLLGLANVVLGGAFVGIGLAKQEYIQEAMDQERITLQLTEEQIAAGELVDDSKEAQAAADLIREHRHNMGTYDEVLGGGRFDPANPQHLVYAQALNLENYLYLAVNSFGLVTVAIASGASMLLTGIALAILGIWVFLGQRKAGVAVV